MTASQQYLQVPICLNRQPTRNEIQKYGSRICKQCGRLYKKRHQSKNSDPDQCGHCNRSQAAYKRIDNQKATKQGAKQQ